MKKYSHHFIPLFIASLFFIASCGKKSSSDPVPEPEKPATGSNKPAAPTNLRGSEAQQQGDGTVRTAPTTVTVGTGSVTVQEAEQQRTGMSSEKQTDLNALLGPGSQGRNEGTQTENKDYGWYISDLTINGVAYEPESKGLQSLYFFNIDAPGYYWQYDYKTTDWVWGTWAVDRNMTYLALDYDSTKKKFVEMWSIVAISPTRMVLKLVNDTTDVLIGLNGFDLTDDAYNGQTTVSNCQQRFIGGWKLSFAYKTDSTLATLGDPLRLFLNQDGTYYTQTGEGTVAEYDFGNWVLEEQECFQQQGQYIGSSILYDTYYDDNTQSYVTESYTTTIFNDGTSNNVEYLLLEPTDGGASSGLMSMYFIKQ